MRFSEEAIENWKPAPTGKRGTQQKYSDLAIETGLTLRLSFHLPLSSATPAPTEGFLGSVVSMLGLEWDIPDPTTFSRRGGMVRATLPGRLVTDEHASDAPQVPGLLDHITDPIQRFIADGVYDRAPVYEAVST